jgi:hypothetical protein
MIFLYYRTRSNDDYWGGKREGAGRPSIGTPKNIKLTLPDGMWDWLDNYPGSRSEVIRELIQDKMIKESGQLDMMDAIRKAQQRESAAQYIDRKLKEE